LYRERRTASVRLAVLLVDRVDVAEELVQDAFVALYRCWDGLEEPAAYLRTAVVNRCRDVQRHRAVVNRHPEPRPEPVLDAPDEVRDVIRTLPDKQRTALVLRFYEDLSVDQIATVMATRPGTVKSLLHRALQRLRDEMGPEMGTGPGTGRMAPGTAHGTERGTER
jgi:RNA polymerase sigma factor (sigma-70 family)